MKFVATITTLCIILLSVIFVEVKKLNQQNHKLMEDVHYQRVVTLAPSMSDTIVALGQAHRVVGKTIHCIDAQLTHAANVGSFAEPNFESILQLKPDLVLAVPHVLAKATLARLEENNIVVFAHQPDTLADIKYIVLAIAERLGILSRGHDLNHRMDRALEEARRIADHVVVNGNKSILIAVSSSPFVVAGKSTFASQIVETLGLKNMAEDGRVAWPVWPLENLLRSPPQILLLTEGVSNRHHYAKIFDALGLDEKKSSMRLLVPDRPIFNSPSPVLIDDAAYLGRLLQMSI